VIHLMKTEQLVVDNRCYPSSGGEKRPPDQPTHSEISRPQWLGALLIDRGTRKPSEHTAWAHRQTTQAV
jgi:hypothetical protein